MNIVKGMTFKANLPIFSGSYKSPRFVKDVEIEGIITEDCSYDSNNKHWLYFEVTKSSDESEYKTGKVYKKQGKNIYKQIYEYKYPQNYKELAQEKDSFKKQSGLKPLFA
jgi:hypothetical protein